MHWPEIMWNHLRMLNQDHNDHTSTWEMVNSRADYPQRAQQFRTSSCLSRWAGHEPGKGRWVAQQFRSVNCYLLPYLPRNMVVECCWCLESPSQPLRYSNRKAILGLLGLQAQLLPDVVTFNTASSACGKVSEWQRSHGGHMVIPCSTVYQRHMDFNCS